MRLLSLLLILSCMHLHAQVTLTLQPDAETGKDSEVFSLQPNSPLATDLLRGNAWTFSGNPGYQRGLIDFDLSTIPVGSQIISARLSLYSPGGSHSQSQSGDNACYLSRITGNWTEETVTWNSQPSYTTLHQVTLQESTNEYQDYEDIDVTLLVRDMVEDPNNSFGFILKQQSEQTPRRMAFCSSDFVDADKHPKLVITYTPPDCTTLILRPGASGKDAEIFSLQPLTNFNSDLFRGNAWTFSGNLGIERGFIDFNLAALPANVEINAAYLSLFAPDIPNDQLHSGDNGVTIRRITGPWNETTVTWNNQPNTTSTHQINLQAAEAEYQNYLNINVTDLLKDMIADPSNSYGFMMRLQTESEFRRMTFCSSDYANPQKHPKLEICYTPMVAVEPVGDPDQKFTLYPNPAGEWLFLKQNNTNHTAHKIEITDIHGQVVLQQDVLNGDQIYVGNLTPALYHARILGDQHQTFLTTTFSKQ
jgi:Secretion system C-terminal sorting domain